MENNPNGSIESQYSSEAGKLNHKLDKVIREQVAELVQKGMSTDDIEQILRIASKQTFNEQVFAGARQLADHFLGFFPKS